MFLYPTDHVFSKARPSVSKFPHFLPKLQSCRDEGNKRPQGSEGMSFSLQPILLVGFPHLSNVASVSVA